MNIGRIGNNQLTRLVLNNIQGQMDTQNDLFAQISANKKILKPSDDPVAANQMLALSNELSTNTQYQNNVNVGKMWTSVTSNAMQSVNDIWIRVNEIAISAADGTKSASDFASMGEEVEQLLENLVQLSNSSNAGKYIFSGSKTNTAAFSTQQDEATGQITGVYFEGDTEERNIKTSDKGDATINMVGSNSGKENCLGVFIDDNKQINAFNTLIELRDRLNNNNIIGFSQSGGMLDKIQNISDHFTDVQVKIGGVQQVLDLDRNLTIQQNADTQESLSSIGELDLAAAIMELNKAQNTYEASLAAAGRITQKGLIDYI